MKKKSIDTILDFINKYRAVTFGALRMNLPHISDETIFCIISILPTLHISTIKTGG